MSSGLLQNIADILHEAIDDHNATLVFAWLKNKTTKTAFIAKATDTSKVSRSWCEKVVDLKPYQDYYGENFEETLLHKIKTEREEKGKLVEFLKVNLEDKAEEFIETMKNKEIVIPILVENHFINLTTKALKTIPVAKINKGEVLRVYFKRIDDKEGVKAVIAAGSIKAVVAAMTPLELPVEVAKPAVLAEATTQQLLRKKNRLSLSNWQRERSTKRNTPSSSEESETSP